MDPCFESLLCRLDHLSSQFRELKEGVSKAIRIADEDPEMALTRARKVLEYVIRDIFERRRKEPPGTRPLENLLQLLVKDGHFPDRLDAYATTIRKLGNVGTHSFGEKVTVADVYQSLTQLMPILEWYFEVERPEAPGPQPSPRAEPETASPATRLPWPLLKPRRPLSPRACGRSTPMTPISFSICSPAPATRTVSPRAFVSGSIASRKRRNRHSPWV